MNFSALVSSARNFPVFGDEIFAGTNKRPSHRHLQLSRWAKQGKVIRLKRGLYTLPEEYRRAPLSLRWLANTLYSPSYLSLEYMLSWYDMIPERVAEMTSVTTLKTASFTNALGHFSYRSLKKRHFFGFEETTDESGRPVLLAVAEKALLDYIYLYSGWENSEDFIDKNIRLQQLDQLNAPRLKAFAKRFDSKKLFRAVDFLLSRSLNTILRSASTRRNKGF